MTGGVLLLGIWHGVCIAYDVAGGGGGGGGSLGGRHLRQGSIRSILVALMTLHFPPLLLFCYASTFLTVIRPWYFCCSKAHT